MAELKKIETRKKERERKQQDLQKLISAAEQNAEKYVMIAFRVSQSLLLVSCAGRVRKSLTRKRLRHLEPHPKPLLKRLWCLRAMTSLVGLPYEAARPSFPSLWVRGRPKPLSSFWMN